MRYASNWFGNWYTSNLLKWNKLLLLSHTVHTVYKHSICTVFLQCMYSRVVYYSLRILKYNIGYSYSYVEWHTKKYLFYENNSKIKIRLSKFLLKFSIFNIKVKFFLSKYRHMACLSRGLWLVSWQCEVRNLIGVTHLTKNPKTSQI